MGFPETDLGRREAYNKAVKAVTKDPLHFICAIAKGGHGKFALYCWKVQDGPTTNIQKGVPFFSELKFKWSDKMSTRPRS